MKTLLISGYAERSLMPLKSGDVDAKFLQKPFAPTELLARVGELLAGDSLRSTKEGNISNEEN